MNRPVAGVNQGDSLRDWFQGLPIVTKILFVSTLSLGALTTFGMISPGSLILEWHMVSKKFQIWRLLTNFMFAGTFSFPYAMHLYILYENSLRYERNPFNTGSGGTSSDYLYMIMLGMAALSLLQYLFDLTPVLSEPLLYMILYVWSRREPEGLMNMMGFKFKALYLPWVYIAFRLIMGGSIVLPIFGIAVGHLYYFLVEVLPLSHGINSIVKTPGFVVRLVEYLTGMTQQGAAPRPAAAAAAAAGAGPRNLPPRTTGYNWGGGGRTLGRN